MRDKNKAKEYKPQHIVAEITRNWHRMRGYDLESWKFSQVRDEDEMTETIIAVFKLV